MQSEFRRQFILGNKVVREDWNHTKINNKYFLSTQHDLEVVQIKEKQKELTLIGYIINPHKPSNSNVECLKSILDNVNSINDIFEELYIYSGRFTLIGCINEEIIIVGDPCGLRQVYYTQIENNTWFASQPNLLAKTFNIPKRKDKQLNDFIKSPTYEYYQRLWVGDDCIYENVRHLMPNYYYDFPTNIVKRYWVNKERNISFQSAVEKAANILQGSMEAISKRGNLIQGLTAGWDSRMLLAASKHVKDDIQYYISLGDDKFSRNTDLRIAIKLANDLDLNLHVIEKLEDVREEIASYIKNDVTQGRNIKKTRTIQYFYDKFPNTLNVNGNISEIARNYFGTSHPNITADYLVKLIHYENIPFAKENLIKWMDSVPDFVLKDIEFPDLLYWEQKMGNWCAMQKAEQDIALEDFSPFNNRQLLMTLYNVDKKYREPGSYVLYKSIIEKLWKETLSHPINPDGFVDKVIKRVKVFIPDSMKSRIKTLIG